ncbi:gamma-glutamylcyclotransferase [Pantanalinema rosaneae CENA516]|uniref:allophanate hydrolase-related protein n=1 Tax=Pantanalinema rosaneae TaxID=1620701 RepID=UPI003D6FD302
MTQAEMATKRVFICGSALRGQPGHGNLGEAKFIREAKTRSQYRLHSAHDGWHPAIYQVAEQGIAIPGEVYELSLEQFDQLVASEPPHMYAADVVLEDGEVVTAFLYPQELVEQYNWLDISDYGGWAAYKASQPA